MQGPDWASPCPQPSPGAVTCCHALTNVHSYVLPEGTHRTTSWFSALDDESWSPPPLPVIQGLSFPGCGPTFQPLFVHPHPLLSSFHTHRITGHPENPVSTMSSASLSAWTTLPISLYPSRPRGYISNSDVMYRVEMGEVERKLKN